MANFFSSIQGKFKATTDAKKLGAKYEGRYLGNIIEHIAEVRPEIVDPFIKQSGLPPRKKGDTPSVSSEYVYDQPSKDKNRRADLCIEWEANSDATLLVEIKINDSFLDGQIDAYGKWAKKAGRAVVILTAHPLDPKSEKLIKKYRLTHCYLSQYADKIALLKGSELLKWFYQYLKEEGYAMYDLLKDKKDYNALLSFMALNFLPHASGKGRAVSKAKIAKGPDVFSNLVSNWQLMSNRLAKGKLQAKAPSIRYFPEQGYGKTPDERDYSDEWINLDDRSADKQVRNIKAWGRYYLTAHLSNWPVEGLTLEWGQVISIQKGKTKEEIVDIECLVYAAIILKGRKIVSLCDTDKLLMPQGIKNPKLYAIEEFMKLVMDCIEEAAKDGAKRNPEIKKNLAFYAPQ